MYSHFNNCHEPKYDDLPLGKEFCGYIRTIVNTKKKICFVVRQSDIETLEKIENFKPKNEDFCGQLPCTFQTLLFYHKHRQKYYRAYRLPSTNQTSEHFNSMELFLFDTGELIKGRINDEDIFFLNDELYQAEALALLCQIEALKPSSNIKPIDIENLEIKTQKLMKFVVKKNSGWNRHDLYQHGDERCLVLSILEEFNGNEVNKSDEGKSKVTRFFEDKSTDSSSISTISLNDLPIFETTIKSGSMICVYPNIIFDNKSFYANIMTIDDITPMNIGKNIINDEFAMRIWMNSDEIIKNYKRFNFEYPSLNQVVIVENEKLIFHRAVITKFLPDTNQCEVFFIDIGSKQEISLKNIYKLPTKCTNLSSQCILLKVTNLNRNLKCNDLDLLPNMMMAKVMSTTLVNSLFHIKAQLYTLGGNELDFYLAR